MKFLPTITLTDAVYAALRNGQLRLQCGQWIRIPGDPPGVTSKPSRFVKASRVHLDIVHPDGPFATGRVSNERFKTRAKNR
jgi:hypothetical protein